jgi:hypothetical protein
MRDAQGKDFATIASEQAGRGPIREFLDFLRYNKKWWLLPILVTLLLLGLLMVLAGSGAAPYIYTLF